MSKRQQGTLLRASRYDADNLAVARLVLENPERHPVCTVAWARAVLARLGDGDDMEAQRRLPLGPDSEESRSVRSFAADAGEAGGGKTSGLAGEKGTR